MSSVQAAGPGPLVFLRLGRVSNLPTVWTNVLAGTVLAGGDLVTGTTVVVLLAMSLFYIGGMYLNDAFDHAVDARDRPERPVPSGQVHLETVFVAGFAMLISGLVLMALSGFVAGLVGVLLAAAIVGYDVHHKANPLSPVLMGICRALVVIGAAAVVAGAPSPWVLAGAAALFAHVVGLTYAAKQEALDRIERLWPIGVLLAPLVLTAPTAVADGRIAVWWLALAAVDGVAIWILRRRRPGTIPVAVGLLIAAISLVDALLVSATEAGGLALVCAAGFVLTLLLQRLVPGT